MYVETTGQYPNLKYTYRGTEAEILASTPKVDQRVEAFTTDKTPARKYDWLGTAWSFDAGSDVEPGSPSSPFASVAELSAALPTGPSDGVGGTAWYLDPASPIGRLQAMWKGAAWSGGYVPGGASYAPSIPTTPYSGFVTIAQYPGSMLSWDAAQGKNTGTLGSSFADFGAVQAVPVTYLALGVTAQYHEVGKVWETEYTAAGWVRSAAYSPLTNWSNTSKHPELLAMGCVAAWDFDSSSPTEFVSKIGKPHRLVSAGTDATTIDTSDGPVSGKSLVLNGTSSFLRLLAEDAGSLSLSGLSGKCTVLALVKKTALNAIGFVAGIWQENNNDSRRQYGLFVDLPMYGGDNKVCGHVSKTGGASPNIPYSRDCSANKEWIYPGEWQLVAMTYDGATAKSYLHGRFEEVPSYTEPGAPNGEGLTYAKNPYNFALGLNNTRVGDFTVGAVRLTAGMSNFFGGKIGALAVFADALTQKQINAAATTLLAGSATPVVWYPFRWQNFPTDTNHSIGAFSTGKTYYDTTCLNGTTEELANPNGRGFRLTKISGNDSFIYRSATETTPPNVIWIDPQTFGIPFSKAKSISIVSNNGQKGTATRFCLKIGADWYALSPKFYSAAAHASGADWSGAETFALTLNANTTGVKLKINPGVELSESAQAVTISTLTGDIEALGLYVTGQIGGSETPVRFRDLKLFA